MKWWGWAVFVVLLGALLRLSLLDLRPMHTDEAVHAVKFGTLLETGVYRYDRNEYHGPTLNYFTLLPAWVVGEGTLAELSEGTLRIVPALFGIGLVLLILSLRSTGPTAVAAAAFLAACSPIMTYYSRYYIQETLLVFFTMGLIVSVWRFLARGHAGWAVAAGISAGLMFATKETWVISIGAMGVSLLATHLIRRREGTASSWKSVDPVRPRSVALGVAAGVAVSVLFFSSFFTHWEGLRDSILAYQTYVGRAGEASRHGNPWHHFLQMLIWWHEGPGPIWTEASIVIFGAAGILGSFFGAAARSRSSFAAAGNGAPRVRPPGGIGEGSGKPGPAQPARDLRIFLGVYACLMLIIVSALPYKTPWLVLGALLPLILMAGWGVADFLAWLPVRVKVPGYVLIAILGVHLVWQSYLANFEYYDNPSNPMVYAHPTDDVRQIAQIVADAAAAAPGDLPVQVVVSGDEYWPLPWYFRRLPRVGWWSAITNEFTPTPVILVSPDMEQDLIARLYAYPPPGERPLYVPLFERPMFLRPGREIRGYVTLELSNRLRQVKG
jgi:uncharacterized protein (TIGR03663 family)